MATLSTTRNYEDGEILTQADLDAFLDDIEIFINITKLNDDNLQNNGITGSTKLVTGSVTAAKLAADSVTTAKIVDSNVTTAKIADANVTTVKIADDNVTFAKMQNIATARLIGRTTASTGDPEEISVSAGMSLAGGVLGITSASQAEMEAASSTTVPVTPGRTQYHPGVAKAWVLFDDSGNILASYGVTSVTSHGSSLYTVNFTTAFSSANYATVGMAARNTGGAIVTVDNNTLPTTTAVKVRITTDAGGAVTSGFNTVMVFGDQ